MPELNFDHFPDQVEIKEGYWLRQLLVEDAADLQAMFDGDTNASRYIPWASEDKTRYISRVRRDMRTRGPRYGLVHEEHVWGVVSIFPSDGMLGVVEIGYVLHRDVRGQGLAVLATKKAQELVASMLPDARVALAIDDTNKASIRIATKLGYVPTDTISGAERGYFRPNE